MRWMFSADGEQARALATELPYDLIVLDLNLPRLDGVSILKEVRGKKPTLPILILTAKGKIDDRVQCLDSGAEDYLVKPFSFSELSARIRALLRRSRLPSFSILKVDDLELDRVERRVTRRESHDRTHDQRVRAPGISDAECWTECDANHDHRARLESVVR